MGTPETKARLADLAERIRDLEAVFACGGTIALPAPVTLRFADGRSIRVVREHAWRRSVGRRLMARCQPAPFGVGRKTYHDRSVRDGGQLLARDGAVGASGLDLNGTGMLTEIGRTLCPGDERDPEAELYALNVYGPRGHFVAHKDTPRDPDVFGTLVVCLPLPFRGGALVLRHDSIRRFEWETADSFGFGQRDDSYPVQWAAFYNDVDHEVEPVTDGTRVTLTWLLRAPRPMHPFPENPRQAKRISKPSSPRRWPAPGSCRQAGSSAFLVRTFTRQQQDARPSPGPCRRLGRRRSKAGIASLPLPRRGPVFVYVFDHTCSKRAETRAGGSRVHRRIVNGRSSGGGDWGPAS